MLINILFLNHRKEFTAENITQSSNLEPSTQSE